MQLTKSPEIRRSLLVLLILFLPGVISAKFNQCPIFDWVKVQSLNAEDTIPAGEISNGAYFLLIDRQFNEFTKQVYYHYGYKVVTEQGVQNSSEISIDYMPAYQKFFLHNIRIIRNGNLLTSGVTSQIKEIQQERDLDNHIYDEAMTVYIVLKDVRPGDVIEYDFTIEGFNPIFGSNIYLRFSPNLSYTLPHFYYRILKQSREVKYKYYNNAPLPQVIRSSDREEWVWDYRNNKPVEQEDYMPEWYSNYPIVEISSFTSWKGVEKWGMEVFDNTEKLGDGFISEIDSIITRYPELEKQVIAAVRFVQKQIRYLGIEIGENSHKPTSPNKVFLQRHGDCKDKSLLLCKMLNKIGVEAYPVLVNTWLASEISERVPSANIFNHVIVKAIVNGTEYWFDPTISTQEGDLKHTEIPDYGYGLVLDGNLKGLDLITRISNTKTHIQEKLEVEDYDGNAVLKIVTGYYGEDADRTRYSFSQNTLKEIQKNYLQYYQNTYDSITVETSLTFTDNTEQNIFTTFEHYRIKGIWSEGEDKMKLQVSSYHISEKIQPYLVLTSNRIAPLAINFPKDIHHAFEIVFPDNWDLETSDDYISSPYFYFSSKSSSSGNVCNIDYHLNGYKNSVPPENTGNFLSDIKKIDSKFSGMVFTYNPSLVKTSFSFGLFFMFVMFLVLLIILIVWLYRKKGSITETHLFSKTLGGWLILPVLGLFLTPVSNLISLITGNLFDSSTYAYYTTVTSSDYHVLWEPFWVLNLLVHAAYLVFPVLILVLIFRYDRRVPVYMIYFYAVNVFLNILMFILIKSINTSDISLLSECIKDLVRSIIIGSVWIPYFIYSSRVKETFVR
jgi:transglutaminase-like putative cysteine protease